MSTSVLVVNERPFTTVDTEAQFDAALAAGRWILIRGEGTGGVISMTTQKNITHRYTEIRGPGHLQFTLPQVSHSPYWANQPNAQHLNPRGIMVMADDVTLRGFEMSSTQSIAPSDGTVNDPRNTSYGIGLASNAGALGHRLKLIGMQIHHWSRCISKDAIAGLGHNGSTPHDDILIDRCYIHSFNYAGAWLNYGLRRLIMRDTRVVGDLGGANNLTHHNGLAGGTDWWDCVVENCDFRNVGRMGTELVLANFPYAMERIRFSNVSVENCLGMGISFGTAGVGIVIERCKVKDVQWIGIELAGIPPEKDLGTGWRYTQGIIESCEVDGVKSWGMAGQGDGQSFGISIDGAQNSVVRGATIVKNITSTHIPGDGAVGISVMGCERCSVRGATVIDGGRGGIYVGRGFTPNTRGWHEVVGNTIRNTFSYTTAGKFQCAVNVFDTRCEVSNNIAWQATGTTLSFACSTVFPSLVTCEGVNVPPGNDVVFTGSNIIYPVPHY